VDNGRCGDERHDWETLALMICSDAFEEVASKVTSDLDYVEEHKMVLRLASPKNCFFENLESN